MKTTGLFFASLLGLPLAAQVTLTQPDFPQAGDVYYMNLADTTGVQPGSSGTNVTWNFTALNMQGVMTDSFLVVGATPYGASFPQANLAVHETGPGVNYFIYYDNGSAQVNCVGRADSINIVPFSNPATYYIFPVSYGATHNDTYSGAYGNAMYADTVHVNGTSNTDADGTGTLQLPNSTTYNNVLRVHYVRNESDTNFNPNGDYAYWIYQDVYSWYLPGDYYPVLSMYIAEMDLGFTTAYQKFVAWRTPPLGITETPALSGLSVFPNPASTDMQVITPSEGTIGIYSSDGKLLQEQETNGQATIDISSFSTGMYFLVFRNNTGVLRRTITITH